MDITALSKFLFVMPLDHPFKYTADYQNQTAQILSQKFQLLVLAYRSYEAQLHPWQLFSSKNRAKLYEKNIQGNILQVSPLHIIPFERFALIYQINKKLSFIFWVFFAQMYLRRRGVFLWIFHPRFYWLKKTLQFLPSKVVTLYDCLDYVSSIQPKEEKLLRHGEKELFEQSDLVVFNSHFLAKYHNLSSSRYIVSPSGFVLPLVKKSKKKIHTKKKPVVGFAGSLNYRIDYDLMYEVCKTLPNISFMFVGQIFQAEEDQTMSTHTKMANLFSLSNVKQIDFLPRQKLYKQMNEWNIGIIPYDLSIPLNYFCKPLKLYEYFYFGLPVVSTPIPSIKTYKKFVSFTSIPDEWVSEIKYLLKTNHTKKYQAIKRKEAENNTWGRKIEKIFEHLSFLC